MAMYIAWKEMYSVGDESIDAQHRQILLMINRLHEAIRTGHEYDELRSLLDRMVHYTVNHFRHEEQLMQACAYPDFDNHKAQHDQMRRRTEGLRANLGLVTGLDMARFLKDWWTNHILSEDHCYVPYLRTDGHLRPLVSAPTQPVSPVDWPGQTPTHY